MSSLEEYNINLFLTNLSKLKLSNIDDKLFGEKKEKVFREYENFPEVLNGIAKLSRQLEKITSVRGYDADRKLIKGTLRRAKGATLQEGNYCYLPVRGQVNSIYNTNIYEESPYETGIYFGEDFTEEDTGNLGRAFKQIFKIHQNYLNDLRKFFLQNFIYKKHLNSYTIWKMSINFGIFRNFERLVFIS